MHSDNNNEKIVDDFTAWQRWWFWEDLKNQHGSTIYWTTTQPPGLFDISLWDIETTTGHTETTPRHIETTLRCGLFYRPPWYNETTTWHTTWHTTTTTWHTKTTPRHTKTPPRNQECLDKTHYRFLSHTSLHTHSGPNKYHRRQEFRSGQSRLTWTLMQLC